MELTRLEIKGFKSFGDKVSVNFDAGITGVVGPNGCGKSNIVDAIRWVLGEQKTRALRSEKMENIIFNGTKKRKALQMAEVSLTFKNTKNLLPTEYSEVTITRRYYRSGDSEYLLNGVTCRLKDINNLFLDTGIGPDSYAIIELKMVDDILNDKDNSRRTLFEEAAGISKFKIRKKQTLKKLDDTDKDLERVEDLLHEIEKNLKSLEKQARQAERYMKHKEDYKRLSVILAKKNIQTHRESLESLQKRFQEENDKKNGLFAETRQLESKLEKLKKEQVDKEKLLSSRQKTLNEHINTIRQYENDKKIRNERQRYLTDRRDRLQNQINEDKNKLDTLRNEIKLLREEAEAQRLNNTEASQLVDQLKNEYDLEKEKAGTVRNQIRQVQERFEAHRQEIFELRKSLEINQAQLDRFKNELNQSDADRNEQAEKLESFKKQLQELAEQIKVKNDQLTALEEAQSGRQQQIESLENELAGVSDSLNKNNRSLDAAKNEYSLTKSMIDNLEGYPEAIKFLRKQANWQREAPLLSDIIACEENYRMAIENFLEPWMNYYVVDEADHAYQAVNILSEAAKGKANFFILNSFKKEIEPGSSDFKGYISATEVTEYDEKYRNLIHYLLQDVYLQSEKGVDIPVDTDNIFISANGKITRKAHSVSGGSVGLFDGKRIGRLKNQEKLKKRIRSMENEAATLQVKQEQLKEKLQSLKDPVYKNEIEDVKSQVNALNEQYISLKTREEQLDSFLSSSKGKQEDIANNIRILEGNIEKSTPNLKMKEAELENIESELNEQKALLDEQNEIVSEKSTAFNDENIKYHQYKNKLEGIEEKADYREQTIEESESRIKKNAEDLQSTEEDIKKLINTVEVKDDDLVKLYEEKESIEQGVNEAEKAYYQHRGEIDDVQDAIRNDQKKREQVDVIIMELQEKINETRLKLTSTRERLSVEFKVDLDQLLLEEKKKEGEENEDEQDPDEDLSIEILAQKTEHARQKMDNVGPINPMAMEAFEEIKERYDFITSQRDDLAESKSSLLNTISEIDQVAKQSFLEAFDKIRDNFQKVFRSLFTEEDNCDLKLQQPDSPLESGIDIMARPKGKRPLGINQLSGGEKTLTAVALLFSIYLLKPAPFCIFDEVDAPLDDANIDKFNNIIKEFSRESQFIIVTHNKRTMSSTDVIYGVTMQEEGVSKLVPVDLRSLV